MTTKDQAEQLIALVERVAAALEFMAGQEGADEKGEDTEPPITVSLGPEYVDEAWLYDEWDLTSKSNKGANILMDGAEYLEIKMA